MKDAAGAIVGASKTGTGHNRRKRAEAALRQAQADLAYMSRVTTMGELTASLAHEIRQPISAAVTNARTCLRWLGREAPDVAEASEAASRIVKDATRAADIISRISLLFKKGALQRELVDVNDVIRENDCPAARRGDAPLNLNPYRACGESSQSHGRPCAASAGLHESHAQCRRGMKEGSAEVS